MKQLGMMVGLALVAIACGSGADMMGEIMDSGVADAGAQPGDLRVECDITEGNSQLAQVAASELPGVFNPYLCTEAEGGIPGLSGFGGEVVCAVALPAVMADGSYRFDCTQGNGGYFGSTFTVPEPRHIRIVR